MRTDPAQVLRMVLHSMRWLLFPADQTMAKDQGKKPLRGVPCQGLLPVASLAERVLGWGWVLAGAVGGR
ncbi:hypothetical protein GCM10009828_095220 [Actinoplanes couchii]|uniref:Uncharacterized protein n=1 Tax=Actinoplanes couchii TaxID=403638 RepID=A0ABQ3XSR1_9ACTN|nr:hypothetical protein Aco03nite_099510 [Actinoplanes couchii]